MSLRSRSRSENKGQSISLALAVIAVMALIGGFNWLQKRNTAMPTTVDMVVHSGRALVTRADAGEDPPVEAGTTTTLQRGDMVQVGPAAKVQLVFEGGETVDLGNGTRVTLIESHLAAVSRSLIAVLALHEGQVLTQIKHTLFSGMRFEIETAVVTVHARGTLFRVDVIEKSHVYVEVFEGIVDVVMGEQTVELEAGQHLHARFGEPLTEGGAVRAAPALEGPALQQPTTLQPGDSGTPAPSAPLADVTPTYTDPQKTLFAPVLTPTRPGDHITTYTVVAGDTLFSISRKFGVPWKDIWEANKAVLPDPEKLREGQTLRIPAP